MGMRNFTIPTLLMLACLCPGMAMAAGCSLKMVNTVPMELANNGARVFVPVVINGTPERFMLDTGGDLTQISAAVAEELKLPSVETNIKMLDLYGNASTKAVKVDTFVLGRLRDRNTTLPISTFFQNGGPVAGLLAADYMGEYDTELDFAGGKMNYFSQDHCPGNVVYWPAAAIAVVPMRLVDRHLHLDVMLDGHPFRAMIDTGATGTTLTTEEAKRVFDLSAEDADKRFEHTFQKLSFDGLEVGNPHITVIPDKTGSKDPNNGYATGTRVHMQDDPLSAPPPMLIGMNILSKLHLYIAFSEHKIYITPASAPAQPVQTAPAQ
jgi:predicted aspartyl protease